VEIEEIQISEFRKNKGITASRCWTPSDRLAHLEASRCPSFSLVLPFEARHRLPHRHFSAPPPFPPHTSSQTPTMSAATAAASPAVLSARPVLAGNRVRAKAVRCAKLLKIHRCVFLSFSLANRRTVTSVAERRAARVSRPMRAKRSVAATATPDFITCAPSDFAATTEEIAVPSAFPLRSDLDLLKISAKKTPRTAAPAGAAKKQRQFLFGSRRRALNAVRPVWVQRVGKLNHPTSLPSGINSRRPR